MIHPLGVIRYPELTVRSHADRDRLAETRGERERGGSADRKVFRLIVNLHPLVTGIGDQNSVHGIEGNGSRRGEAGRGGGCGGHVEARLTQYERCGHAIGEGLGKGEDTVLGRVDGEQHPGSHGGVRAILGESQRNRRAHRIRSGVGDDRYEIPLAKDQVG